MNPSLPIRYGGRAAGAVAAYYIIGRRLGTVGVAVAVAAGWLAGGYLIDKATGADAQIVPTV